MYGDEKIGDNKRVLSLYNYTITMLYRNN